MANESGCDGSAERLDMNTMRHLIPGINLLPAKGGHARANDMRMHPCQGFWAFVHPPKKLADSVTTLPASASTL